MMAICSACGNLAEHSIRHTGAKASKCKACVRAYSRAHYRANRERDNPRRAVNKQRDREKRRLLVQEAKSGPCTDCQRSWPPYVMQFDHRDPVTKCFNIGDSARNGVSLQRLLDEIAKCDPVCGNCHAIREHNRREGRHYLDGGRGGGTRTLRPSGPEPDALPD